MHLRYTKDGSNWYGIADTPNDGVYTWTLPCASETLRYCRVKVRDLHEGFPYDISDDFTITPGPLYAPTNLSFYISFMPGSGIKVEWTDNNCNEQGYQIERRDSTNWVWQEIGSTGRNATWFEDTTNLVGSEVYWYRVRAYNEAGYSPYSEEKWVRNRPNPPSNFTANTLCDNSNLLFLSWEPPVNQKIPIEYYQLYIVGMYKCERWFIIYGLGDTLCLRHDLEPEERYLVEVKGFDEEGMQGRGTGYVQIVPGHVEQCSPEFCESSEFEIFWVYVPGDANGDSTVNLGDVVYLIEYLYKEGPPPCIPETADPNGTCVPELGDIVTLIDYLYRGGAPPMPGCWHGDRYLSKSLKVK